MRKLLLILLVMYGAAYGQSPMFKLIPKKASGAVHYFAPTDSSGMIFWVDADTLGLSNTTPVSSWTDLTGNGRNGTNTGTNRGTIATGETSNGKSTMNLASSLSQYFNIGAGGIPWNTDLTVFIVFKKSNGNIATLLSSSTWDANAQPSIYDYSTDGLFYSIGGGTIKSLSVASSSYKLYTFTSIGGIDTLRINGVEQTVSSTVVNGGTTNMDLIGRVVGTLYSDCWIAAMGVYNRKLGSVLTVEDYFRLRFNLY